jgi:CubicO group peptidase (beta-lactamase class C family)
MRRRQFMSLLGGAAVAPLIAARGYAGSPDGIGVPVTPDDGWPIVSPDEDGLIDQGALRRMTDRLAASADVHAVVVARGGKLAFEWYFRGNDEVPGRFFGHRVEYVTFDADTLHIMKSASKSVMSLAVGIAIDRGLIPGVAPLDEFVRVNLFEPLGITRVAWDRYWGEADAGGGLHLRPRDMAKIGQLVLSGGRWNGRQIVSKAWIEASTAFRFKATDGQSFGYLWWLGRAKVNGREVDWIGALGRGGQSIRIVPELDLAVAVTAGYYQNYSPRASQAQFSVFRDVLRAIPPPA